MNEQIKRSALSLVGICKKSGHAICGTEQICDAIRKDPARIALVLTAADASDNTRKKLADKCAYYGVRLIVAELGISELGDALGKSSAVAAVAVDDAGLAHAIESKLNL